ncbi:exodeoxyribonuclease V subunit beta [Flavobacterium sp. CS20]|uniref:UvrD-helicase domain-containing protein n=1 Tax=Flavobacterium sp. CS20 TaxID=2775246 RepID=UPI001B39DB83|nr:UvrD-helicase domain-containing protein [Flavobacterium sp. CS20]QTY26100.1 UvrD-helicase domain-containing protein [Flavobacterium sp. CS20]
MKTSDFFIYDASAGSGKTYRITCEYLCKLFKQDEVFTFQNILAITFTNKVAAEMKERIIGALIYFSKLDSKEPHQSLLHDVISETHLSKSDIQKKSLRILKYLIPNYANFEVSTIDSFNHRIIRTFAQDLNLNQNFDVDLDVQPYIEQAVKNLIEDVGKDEQLTEWLVEFVHYKINQNKSGDISFDLKKYAELVLNENNYTALNQLQKYDLKDLKAQKNKLVSQLQDSEQHLKDIAKCFFQLIENHNVNASDFKGNYISNYFKKLSNGEVISQFKSKWHNIKETELYNKNTSASTKEKIDSFRPEIEDLFLRSKDLCIKHTLTERILKSFVPLSMISQVNLHIEQIKAENGILFVNDFNRIISKHIKKQPAPFIYERLGEKFKDFFIDEFQDTSTLQWQNLIPLIDNALASSHNKDQFGSLYLVGDVKQSIYEWRGGDPKQFLNLSLSQSNPFHIKPQKKVLKDNWRSAKTIVEFNNDFFYHAADFLTDSNHKHLYKNAKQTAQKNIDGYVDIQFLPKQDNKDLENENRINILQQIITSVKNQGYNLSDICILVRKKKFGTQIAEAFNALENPINVISQESLLIASDAKVQLLTQFLNFLENPDQNTSIDFAMCWIKHINVNPELHHHILSNTKNLKKTDILKYLKTFELDFNQNIYDSLSLYDKAEYVLRTLYLEKHTNAYLQFFLDEIFDFSKKQSKNMGDFLNYWDDQKTRKSISTSETSDAVKIMTIHKSKGLQFPIVIYAHANFTLADLTKTEDWIHLDEEAYGVPYVYENISESIKDLSPSYNLAYQENIRKEELSNINTAYVCMTRAIEQLYILCEPIKGKNTSFKDILCSFLKQQQLFKEDQNQYTFGKIISKTEALEEKPNNLKIHKFHSYKAQDFYQELLAENILDKNKSKAIAFGQDIHDVLQNINYASDINNLKIENKTINLIKQLTEHNQLKKYYKKPWSIYNESEIAFNGLLFRPDRICINQNKAVIIDYKTGKEETSHLQQLTNYKNAVEALGFNVEEAILVYLSKDFYIKTL